MLHIDLPIYKTGCDLLSLALRAHEQMPRSVKRHLGEKITSHCIEMLDLMAMANATQKAERAMHIRSLLKHLHTVQVLLRVSFTSRFISHKVWADATQLLIGIGNQGGGWLKSASKAPAA
ncbi:MAG: four helix bundle protein [Rhizobacter sp.]